MHMAKTCYNHIKHLDVFSNDFDKIFIFRAQALL